MDLQNDEKSSQASSFQLPSWMKIALLVGVVALASIGYLSSHWNPKPTTPGPGAAELDPDELAKRAPVQDFILTDAGGQQKKLSQFHGNVVILSFWASWCTPCLVELPTFAELERKFHDRGLRVIPVNVDEGNDGKTFATDFWTKKNFPFQTYFDTTKSLAQQFDVDMLPSNFVIDRQGRMVFSSFGANDWTSAQTIDFIEGLLNEGDKDPTPAAASASESHS